MSFRVNFLLLLALDMAFCTSLLFSASFIFDEIPIVGGWNRDQFLFFLSFMLVVDSIHMTIIADSFWQFSEDVKLGEFDYAIIKPVNTIFISFFRYFAPSALMGLIIVSGILIYFGIAVKLSLVAWLSLPLLLLLATFFRFVMDVIAGVCIFYVIEGIGINLLRTEFHALSRWPDFIYHTSYRRIFSTIIPLLLVGSPPVYFLFDQSNYGPLFTMLGVLTIAFVVMINIWRMGVKRYESASS